MKILALSDTHGTHLQIPKKWFEPADILIHAGDISNIGRTYEIIDFLDWFSVQPYEHKIFIAGNHDWGFQENPEKIAELLEKYPTVTYLQDSEVVINGIKFYGSPWQPEFYNWAFNLPRGAALQEKWDLIPEDTNVLITHGPPLDILDYVSGKFAGCSNLQDTVLTKLPVLKTHIFGHIHYSYGTLLKNNILFANAATLSEQYTVTNKPIIIEI